MDMSFNDPRALARAVAGHDDGVALQAMTWHDLCARIRAAQDLRRVMSTQQGGDAADYAGSFHLAAARIITSGIPGVPAHLVSDEERVNPISSADGKARTGTPDAIEGRPATGLR